MALEQEVCGACRRPRDEGEIERGREWLRSREEIRRQRPRRIARGIVVACALVALYVERGRLAAALDGLFDSVFSSPPESPAAAPQAAVAASSATASVAPIVPAPTPVAIAPPLPAPVAAPAVPARALRARRAALPARVPPKLAVQPNAPPPASVGMLRLYGVVFDLGTLRPVADAEVRLSPSGASARTDSDGHYQLDCWPPGPNDAPTIAAVAAKGYRQGQLEDADPSFLTRTPEQRQEALAELSPGDLEDIPVRARDGDSLVPLSFALVPESAAPKN